MGNYRITDFDGFNFQGSGVYTKGGTVGYKKARFKMVHPPHSDPINPYGSSQAPTTYKEIKTNVLLVGDPDDVNSTVESLEAKIGKRGILTGKAGSGGAATYAYLTDVESNWSAPFMDGETQWLHLTVTFQPLQDWS